ncbi:MAG: mannose-1-phosphate guanylyltransferase/mannose-6-phosphate isomerase [Campylobacterales bacterium]|nr:mannose-1-phosphate guanylyltransferase/mannose-6-phosphate isomerase [Campylobacterales bacterium]
MTNVILSGGSGTRLWPISRTLMPKQFVKLFDEMSLFQKTLLRNKGLCDYTVVVSNSEQLFLAIDQAEEVNESGLSFLLEPVGRNTAPAIAMAAFGADKDEILLVSSSDHLIKDEMAYRGAVAKALEFANDGYIVTFGIKPTYAETGYGYIESSGYDVLSFKEKPDAVTADEYIKKGNFYWNSGMFCFKAGVLLGELKKYSPRIYETSLTAYENALKDDEKTKIRLDDMKAIAEDSIDYAVMEKSSLVKVVPCDMGWSDVGSFESLYAELDKDEHGNTNSSAINIDSKNNLILGDERQIATIGVEGLMIVDTPDALLVAKQGCGQQVKNVVAKLKEQGGELHNIHLTAHRPWGTYTVLEESTSYKIKSIVVAPGKRLSLQKHFHRNEHWVVVSGTAKVQNGDKELVIGANESTYIKAGEIHRLENPGLIDLVMIEVQVGEYVGEDDIMRLEDDFKRDEI